MDNTKRITGDTILYNLLNLKQVTFEVTSFEQFQPVKRAIFGIGYRTNIGQIIKNRPLRYLRGHLRDSGLSLCEAFSLPPRAIIETEANRHSAGAEADFLLRLRLRKLAFDAKTEQKNRTTIGCAICFVRDSVGIREITMKYKGIQHFTALIYFL